MGSYCSPRSQGLRDLVGRDPNYHLIGHASSIKRSHVSEVPWFCNTGCQTYREFLRTSEPNWDFFFKAFSFVIDLEGIAKVAQGSVVYLHPATTPSPGYLRVECDTKVGSWHWCDVWGWMVLSCYHWYRFRTRKILALPQFPRARPCVTMLISLLLSIPKPWHSFILQLYGFVTVRTSYK